MADQFYEEFWQDREYQLHYALDSATRDRFPAIQKVWGSLKKPTRVLDFGCGNGVLTHWLYENEFGREVLGVDLSETGIRNARDSLASENLRFLTTTEFEAEALEEPFDALVSSHVLEHLDEPAQFLKSAQGNARYYLFEVPLEDCLIQNFKKFLKGTSKNPLGHVQFFTRKSFISLLQENGYIVIRDYHYASAPFSPYTAKWLRFAEGILLKILGLRLYSKLMATHYITLCQANPYQASKSCAESSEL